MNIKNSKSGVTLSVVVVAIILMLIVISSASIIGSRAISTANFEEYKSELSRVANNINEYYLSNNKLPVTNEIIDVNTVDTGLKNAIIKNGDNNDTMYVVDISLVGDATIENGNGTVSSKNVYLVASKSQNVYYLKGFKYNGTVYYNN